MLPPSLARARSGGLPNCPPAKLQLPWVQTPLHLCISPGAQVCYWAHFTLYSLPLSHREANNLLRRPGSLLFGLNGGCPLGQLLHIPVPSPGLTRRPWGAACSSTELKGFPAACGCPLAVKDQSENAHTQKPLKMNRSAIRELQRITKYLLSLKRQRGRARQEVMLFLGTAYLSLEHYLSHHELQKWPAHWRAEIL